MQQAERWRRVRCGIMAGGAGSYRRVVAMPLWWAFSRAVWMANDPCDEMAEAA